MNENQANLEIKEEAPKVETSKEKRKREKEELKMKNYANGMISRGEAYQMAKSIAVEEAGHVANFFREPVKASVVQVMALVRMLTDKGIIESEEEFQKYLDLIQTEVNEVEGEGEAVVEEKSEGSEPNGEGNNEAQEG